MKRPIVLFLVAAVLMSAREKKWQLGKLTNAQRSEGGSGILGLIGAHTDYTIESDMYVFVVALKPRAHVILNGAAKFATEKDTLWFIDADGREHKTKIVKQILKEPAK